MKGLCESCCDYKTNRLVLFDDGGWHYMCDGCYGRKSLVCKFVNTSSKESGSQ